MADLLPSTPEFGDSVDEAEPGDDPRVIGVDGDEADDVLAALSSDTARDVLTALHEEPAPPSDVAEEVDTTLQNAQYHLEQLADAGLIEVIGTAYSAKGREMDVYAPADSALVVVAGDEKEAAGLQAALSRLLGAVGLLGIASLLVDVLLGGPTRDLLPSLGGAGGADAGAEPMGAEQVTETPQMTPVATEAASDTAPALIDAWLTAPGTLFFLGGVVALVLALGYVRYVR